MNKNQIEQFFEIHRNLQKRAIEIADVKFEERFGEKPDPRGIADAKIGDKFPFTVFYYYDYKGERIIELNEQDFLNQE
jgi:hypothetical protein